jgi:HlyD family secretion protein
VEEGDSVKEGDLLVRLRQTAYQFAVDQARADLRSARAANEQARSNLEYWDFKYNLAKELIGKGHGSEEELMSAKDQYISAKSAVETTTQSIKKAEIALNQALDYYEKTEILSPLNGVVTDLQYEVGERTMIASPNVPGAIIMTVADLSVLEVEVRVDETDIRDLRIGQKADISVDAFPDTTFEGVVTNVGASAQVTGYTQSEQVTDFLVKVQFLDNYEHIKPNLTAEVDIITGLATNAKHLPIQALVGIENLPGEKKDTLESEDTSSQVKKDKLYEGVYLYDNGMARFRQVKLGIQDQTNIEIISGLEVDQVVITGPYNALRNLEDGDPVEKRETKEQTE